MENRTSISFFIVLLLIYFLNIYGCAIKFSNLDTGIQYDPSEAESIVVLGVEPRVRVSIFTGKTENGLWDCKSAFNVANVWPEKGFIVLKLKPRTDGKNYGIGQLLPAGIGGKSFVVKKGTLIPTFEVPPGQVVYVGTIHTEQGDNSMVIRKVTSNYEAAHIHIVNHYPQLARYLTQGSLKLTISSGGC